MDILLQSFDAVTMSYWEEVLGEWFFYASMVLLGAEFVRYAWQKRVTLNLLGDTITNFVTTVLSFAITLLIAVVYVTGFYYFYENWSLFQIETSWASVIVCVVLADLAYYWEHRFVHRVGIGWATHTVHHSSPHFNISVAYRFGPLDGVFPFPFHVPLAILGFHPLLIFFAEVFVQLYQTALHTEVVRRLPKPFEWLFNTPSHHRVHHGSNPEYLDKNYGGIFIIWDRMFGTFAEERAPVRFGLVHQLESVNPIKVFLHGFTRLGRKMWRDESPGVALQRLVQPPEWRPQEPDLADPDGATRVS